MEHNVVNLAIYVLTISMDLFIYLGESGVHSKINCKINTLEW